MRSIDEIRYLLRDKYLAGDQNDDGTIELIGESFIADEPTIFGVVNDDYVQRELEWYKSESLLVADIPGDTPKIWRDHASSKGEINSNYGYLIFSKENGSQYNRVLSNILMNPGTRHGVMIYTRPSMHTDWTRDGMSDFVCTNTVQYFVRDGKLETVVQMRSNDVVFGYRNDYAWQVYVRDQLLADLKKFNRKLQVGRIVWNAASLHVYPRHHFLIDVFAETGRLDVKVS
jgi:thymidylate synthase